MAGLHEWRNNSSLVRQRRIFYVNGVEFLEAQVSTAPFTLGTPRVLFKEVARLIQGRGFDVSADGNRFLAVQQVESSGSLNTVAYCRRKLVC